MRPLHLVLPGAPRSKKTHNQVVRCAGRPVVLPSKQWRAWRDVVVPRLKEVLALQRIATIAAPVNCKAIFYRDANRGDAVGLYQGLADVLEAAGVVDNDVRIVSWDGSRMRKDAASPRVELVLTPAEDP